MHALIPSKLERKFMAEYIVFIYAAPEGSDGPVIRLKDRHAEGLGFELNVAFRIAACIQ